MKGEYVQAPSIANNNWEWYEPRQNSAPVGFFLNTTLHGLQYLGQRKRHFCERIFWLIAFIAAVVTATVLIWKMWHEYIRTPIVTVFSPNEKTIDQIPFPAVTICNVNTVKSSAWEQYKRNAELGIDGVLPNETTLENLAAIHDIFHICQSSRTFAETFWNKSLTPPDQKKVRAAIGKRYQEFKLLRDLSKTLNNVAQSCDEMIMLCRWLGKVANCSELFRAIETDFGLCCTFNTVPVSLLKRFVNDSNEEAKVLDEWMKADVNYDNLILKKEHGNPKFPYRQVNAGRFAGLSFLVNPELDEYHCSSTDSEGFVVGVNVPLDFPRMMDNGVAVRTKSEVFIGVRPEITISTKSAKQFAIKKRHCYLNGEKQLAHYTKYTTSNCIDECIRNETWRKCRCVRYYMPRSNERLCGRKRYNCTQQVRENIAIRGVRRLCRNCWPSCSEIVYKTEVTSLDIRDKYIDILFNYFHPHLRKPNNFSIVHVYFNVDSVFPRLRKEMSSVINLISNAGGLLGLCMGFSMLSVLEILYHATIRVICDIYRKRCGIDGDEDNINKDKEHDNNINDKTEILQVSALENREVGFLSKVLHRHHQIATVQNFGNHLDYYSHSGDFSNTYSNIKINE